MVIALGVYRIYVVIQSVCSQIEAIFFPQKQIVEFKLSPFHKRCFSTIMALA